MYSRASSSDRGQLSVENILELALRNAVSVVDDELRLLFVGFLEELEQKSPGHLLHVLDDLHNLRSVLALLEAKQGTHI